MKRSQQRKPKQGIGIEEKKGVVEPNNDSPSQQQLNTKFSTKPVSEFIQPSLESARMSNGFNPNQQPHHVIQNTESKVGLLSVFNKEKLEEDEEDLRESEKSKDEVEDILRRLEDIKLAAQEPKLSEEQLEVNDKLQEDEVQATEAIYGENVIVLDREDGLRSFQINIHIDVPDKLVMSTKIGSFCGEVEFGGIGSEAMEITDNFKEFFYSFRVQHTLAILLPFFTISVQWLDAIRISSLCQMLDTIWTEQSGQEIRYPRNILGSVPDWLQNSSLSYLEFDNRIPVDSFEKEDAGDRRAISESVSPDVDIPSILNYNDDKCNEKFRQNLHECCIFLSEYAGTNFIRLPCKHFFCRNCMQTYTTMHAKESVAILCPQIKCKELVPLGLSHLFQKTLDSMSDLVYCPRCETACLEDEDHLAQCVKCFFTFCGLCRDRLHIGIQCMTSEEKLKFLQDRQHSTQLMGKQKQKELDMINQLRSVAKIMRIATQCPFCQMAIYRTEGCNHMHCSNCRKDFGYKSGNVQMIQRQIVLLLQEQQVRAEDSANHADSCPMCRQTSAKVGNNNHIFCWSCQKHYCYLCQKIVKRGSQHYGPNVANNTQLDENLEMFKTKFFYVGFIKIFMYPCPKYLIHFCSLLVNSSYGFALGIKSKACIFIPFFGYSYSFALVHFSMIYMG
ncbi:hypothetical protein MKW98_020493 [Papaver atlanticum]|uniref:RBR-type E3 ubiquitin transferase n=1 Tax=Papaver atlanticum TaxID=357466 RepID=A0AAD4X3H1_9MAGN|nr:hypothetical protein MKW98_020493 [Papaver atlanticum]